MTLEEGAESVPLRQILMIVEQERAG